MKRRAFEILEGRLPGDRVGQAVDGFIMFMIALNVAALILGTVDQVFERAPRVFRLVEAVSLIIFSVEYAARVWVCTEDPRYKGAVTGRLRYMATPMALLDAAAVVPFYLAILAGARGLDLRALRTLRLVTRMARLTRYSRGVQMLGAAVSSRSQELVTAVGLLVVLLILASSLMFFMENEAQPEKFSSIPAAMWWSIVTLTTVGYGDVAPITAAGRVIAGVIAVLGVALLAIPTGIMAASFTEQMQLQRASGPERCPHCGEDIRAEGKAHDGGRAADSGL